MAAEPQLDEGFCWHSIEDRLRVSGAATPYGGVKMPPFLPSMIVEPIVRLLGGRKNETTLSEFGTDVANPPIVWRPMAVTKPSVDELIEDSRSYFEEIAMELGAPEAKRVEAIYREELEQLFADVEEGQEIDIPLVDASEIR